MRPLSRLPDIDSVSARIPSSAPAGLTSLALENMRGAVIVIVVAFHSVLAYLGSLGPLAFPFDQSPYEWRAFPIVDAHRWFGFDLFCAWQDVFLMALMFFLSALFAWPSLQRKRWRRYLTDRIVRLGVPYAAGILIVMPIALYPVYRVATADPSLAGYVQHYLALPFWPNGPMWFLALLLLFSVLGAALHEFFPRFILRIAHLTERCAEHPGRFFAALVAMTMIGYVPLALLFTPWYWSEHGLFALQFSRPLLYAIYYFAGLAIGAAGLERGLLAPFAALERQWAVWLAVALGALIVWMGFTAVTMSNPDAMPLAVRPLTGASFVVACAAGCLLALSVCLRFGKRRSRLFGALSKNAFGIYLFHYPFVVWLQYALLGSSMFAIAKAAIVFFASLTLAWLTNAAIGRVRTGRAPVRNDLAAADFAGRTAA